MVLAKRIVRGHGQKLTETGRRAHPAALPSRSGRLIAAASRSDPAGAGVDSDRASRPRARPRNRRGMSGVARQPQGDGRERSKAPW